MRFIFKTSYTQDLGIFRDDVQRNWYMALLVGLLVLAIRPQGMFGTLVRKKV